MILIDTHALIWLERGDPMLGPQARTLADQAFTDGWLWVSAITFCEVALLLAHHRVRLRFTAEEWRRDLVRRGLRERMIDGVLAIRAVHLADLHRDPADRLIIATALALEAKLLTADERLLQWSGTLDRLDART